MISEINNNIDEIKTNGFETILKPYVQNNYYENKNYFQIVTIPNVVSTNSNYLNNKILFTYKNYQNYSGYTLKEIINLDKIAEPIYFPNEGEDFINLFNLNLLNFTQCEQIGLNTENYFITTPKFNNMYDAYFSCAINIPGIMSGIPGVNPDYIIVQSSINLEKILVGSYWRKEK